VQEQAQFARQQNARAQAEERRRIRSATNRLRNSSGTEE
jgi:hypothetical protein